MALDVAAIQQTLRADGLDGWLLYDFHGSNPIAAGLAGLTGGPHMTTRRWYYLIPAQGSRGASSTPSNGTTSTPCRVTRLCTPGGSNSRPG